MSSISDILDVSRMSVLHTHRRFEQMREGSCIFAQNGCEKPMDYKYAWGGNYSVFINYKPNMTEYYSPFTQPNIFFNNVFGIPSGYQTSPRDMRRREYERQRELEYQRQRELEYQRQRELEYQRQRELEYQRQRELEYERQRELEYERELEYQRQLQLERERQRKLEQQRQLQYQLELERQAEKEQKRERLQNMRTSRNTVVNVEQAENDDCLQIQLFKDYGTFASYEVRVVKKSGKVFLKIESNKDHFFKMYEMNTKALDMGKINWKWFRDENALIISIPKIKESKKKSHKKHAHKEKKLKVDIPKPSESAVFSDSEPESVESSKMERTSSDASEHKNFEVVSPTIKQHRTPSIEDVEDEEFILYRKQMASPIPRSIIE